MHVEDSTSPAMTVSEDDKMTKQFKAAYLMVKGSVAEDLQSRQELVEALQFAGFNPTQRTILRHWPDSTKSLTFSQFSQITEIEPIPTKTTLLALFEKLDIERNGFLLHDELSSNLTTRGEKLPEKVVESLLANAEYNEEKKFYYPKFCEAVLDTREKLANLAVEKLEKDEEEFLVNSKTYKVKRKSCSPEKGRSLANSPTKSVSNTLLEEGKTSVSVSSCEDWNKTLKSKGCFYFENKNIISHHYLLNVKTKARHQISVQSQPQYRNTRPLVDVQLYVFDENKRFICRTTQKSRSDRWSWEGELAPGRYTIIPFTSGARLVRRREVADTEEVALVERSPKIKLTAEFQSLLSDIYSKADLDGNGSLSRTEFNLFNWRTSGEEVSDEEWRVVEENFPLLEGELTLEGFLTLHQMEAEDNDGDDRELRVTVDAMGYSPGLCQDQSSCFSLLIHSQDQASSLSVSALKCAGLLLDKTVTRCAIQADSRPVRVKGTNNVLVYKEVTDHRVTFVIQNKSEANINIHMDLSRSSHILVNKPSLVFTVNIPKKSSVIAAHILPEYEGADWNLEAEAKIVR